MDEIKGDVTESAHRGWIELTSAQFGQTRAGVGSHSPAPREIVVTKTTDSSSPLLHGAAMRGAGVFAVIDFTRGDGGVYLRIEMTDAMISSFFISGGQDATESLTLNFAKVEFTNTPGEPPP